MTSPAEDCIPRRCSNRADDPRTARAGKALSRHACAEAGRPRLSRRRNPRHRRRKRRRQIHADQASDRRHAAHVRRGLLGRRAGRARHSARGDGAAASTPCIRKWCCAATCPSRPTCSSATKNVRYGLLQQRAMVRDAQKILDDLGFNLPAHVMLGDLTIGQQQLIATARATMRGTKFLIFDEPTAYLTRKEADQLFALIRRLKSEGVTIVYISHRMEEVFELADRVSVLRDGTYVGTRNIDETNDAELVRDDDQPLDRADLSQGKLRRSAPMILETRDLSGKGFEDVSMTRARRRNRRPLWADRRRPQRIRHHALRTPRRSRRATSTGRARRSTIRSEHDAMRARHGAGARKPPRPGPLPQPAGRAQHQPADLQAHQQATC